MSPSYTYGAPGVFLACLTVVDTCGTDVFCDSVNVSLTSVIPTKIKDLIGLYPNPATQQVYLDMQLGEMADVRVDIVDLVGNIVLHKEMFSVTEQKAMIDLSGISSAVYFVRIQAGERQYIEKLIVR